MPDRGGFSLQNLRQSWGGASRRECSGYRSSTGQAFWRGRIARGITRNAILAQLSWTDWTLVSSSGYSFERSAVSKELSPKRSRFSPAHRICRQIVEKWREAVLCGRRNERAPGGPRCERDAAYFRVPPECVQAIIAGGAPAIQASIEGAEDDALGGSLAIQERGLNKDDVVCGITASGRTPLVKGALEAARAVARCNDPTHVQSWARSR